MKNRKIKALFAVSVAVICMMVWGLKGPIESEYQNETLDQ